MDCKRILRAASGLIPWRRAEEPATHGLSRQSLSLLNEVLSPELISERETRDGRLVQYLEGWAAIHQANRIFGFDAWAAELVGGVAYHPLRLIDDASRQQLATGMYTATVRVSVKGCLPKTDAGCAFVRADTPEAHETACKGAVTDATKRTLRQFGDQFGNRLYERRPMVEASEEASNPVKPRPKTDEMRRKVVDLSARLGVSEENALIWVQERYESGLDELSPDQLADAVRVLADKLNQRSGSTRERRNGKAAAA